MFSNDSQSGAPASVASATPEPSRRSTTQSLISRDVKIKGDLICNGDVQVDGEVEGNVESRSITIGEGAHIRGTIAANNVRVYGSVNGQIKGSSVILEKTAKVIGDVMHETLTIEPGALFEGYCSSIVTSQPSDPIAVGKDRSVPGPAAMPPTVPTR